MEALHTDALLLIFSYVSEYTPALACVSQRWHAVVRSRSWAPLSLNLLARRGHLGLLRWASTRYPSWAANRILAGAASGDQPAVLEQALEWGGKDYDAMLRAAAEGGHASVVQRARCLGVEDINGMLCAAARAGNHLLVEKATQWGANDWRSMAIAAAEAGREDMIALIQQKAGRSYYKEVLVGAMRGGHDAIMQTAFQLGGVVNSALLGILAREDYAALCLDNGRGSPDQLLNSAAYNGDLALVKLALKWGAYVGGRILSCAAQAGQWEVVTLLLEHTSGRAANSLLFVAAKTGNLSLAHVAKAHGAKALNMALGAAASRGQIEVAYLLKSWGASDYNQMLLRAAAAYQEPMMRLALSWGADNYECLLMVAVGSRCERTVRLALGRGAKNLRQLDYFLGAEDPALRTRVGLLACGLRRPAH
jgi:hypothetical protein